MTMVFGIPLSVLFGQLLLGLINGAFYALLSLGLAIIFGLLRIINFAHGAQYMLGAFVALLASKYLGVNYWLALLLWTLMGTIQKVEDSFNYLWRVEKPRTLGRRIPVLHITQIQQGCVFVQTSANRRHQLARQRPRV